MKIVAITPIKMNNVRTPGKNTKLLSDGTPLIHCIQNTVLAVSDIDEYYIYCSNFEIKKYMLDGVKYIKREEKYDTPEANVLEMMRDFSFAVHADIYIQIHATAPFIQTETIQKAIRYIRDENFDSVFTVRKLQEFLWTDAHPANYRLESIPRTQDMKPWYAETTGMYVYTKDVIQRLHRRIGERPYLLEVSDVEAIDINNPIDFEIADAIYTNIITKG